MNIPPEMTREEQTLFYENAKAWYLACKDKNMKLDMSRGKPSVSQLNLSNGLLNLPVNPEDCLSDGIEARNYGTLAGLPACRRLFAELLGVDADNVFVGGNASLTLMYDIIAKAHTHGLLNSSAPWSKLNKVKFICPAPGYDRHFAICASFGMEMISVPMLNSGPDMDMVEELVMDPDVKGIWCVPKFSNPDGIVYSDETIRRIAALKPAAPDFIIMWDNAYCVHEFSGEYYSIPDILSLCKMAGRPHMAFEFASTSKITFPGAGVSCFACSAENMEYMKHLMSVQSISYDKINQLRHVLFFGSKEGVIKHMQKHAAILRPKFDLVCDMLDKYILPYGIGSYHRPAGGYFVSLYTLPGCARRTHRLCAEAGVTLTNAGATYPYGRDPEDSNLRIAPSFPPLDELSAAMEALCSALCLAAAEKLMGEPKQ